MEIIDILFIIIGAGLILIKIAKAIFEEGEGGYPDTLLKKELELLEKQSVKEDIQYLLDIRKKNFTPTFQSPQLKRLRGGLEKAPWSEATTTMLHKGLDSSVVDYKIAAATEMKRFKLLLDLLPSVPQKYFIPILDGLWKIDKSRGAEEIGAFLQNSPSRYLRALILLWIGERKYSGFEKVVCQYLKQDDVFLLLTAIDTVEKLACPGAIPYLKRVVRKYKDDSIAIKAQSVISIIEHLVSQQAEQGGMLSLGEVSGKEGGLEMASQDLGQLKDS